MATNKRDKCKANRRLCRWLQEVISGRDDPRSLPDFRNIRNPWSMAKDGKRFWEDAGKVDMRK